ncbi:MAG: DUF1232 domain-containing protein [Bacteroidales bacterium]|nr:DUF1232 domain-containing protein [Candidatus Liminaster caballi]
MGNVFVNKFQNGKWLSRSNSMLGNKAALAVLAGRLVLYLKKGGLSKVKEDLHLLGAYLGDIINGRYKEHSKSSLTLAVAAILYVVSPLDIIPDLLPFGFLDDISIVTWAMSKLAAELEKYKSHNTQNKLQTND